VYSASSATVYLQNVRIWEVTMAESVIKYFTGHDVQSGTGLRLGKLSLDWSINMGHGTFRAFSYMRASLKPFLRSQIRWSTEA
jgi:hypothetical protein